MSQPLEHTQLLPHGSFTAQFVQMLPIPSHGLLFEL